MKEGYLKSVKKQFEYYKSLGEKTFAQIDEQDFFISSDAASNSIAIIVNHLYGNMKSRWTDFLTTDGEKKWRDRDSEFEAILKTKEELILKWNEGWQCLFFALDTINNDNFDTEIYIRNQKHSIVEAINRQMMHYAYHVGQIVYIGRMLKNRSWETLSVPKGKSDEFNSQKFSKGKHQGHFTDDFK